MSTGNLATRFIEKVYRNLAQKRQLSLGLVMVLALLLGLFLHRHIQALAFGSWTRESSIEAFATQMREEGFSEKTFWEFREAYAPGFFTFAPTVEHWETQTLLALPQEGVPLHTFTSDHLASHDFVVPAQPNVSRAEQTKNLLTSQLAELSVKTILYQDAETILLELSSGRRILYFFRPIEKLYEVDGLFDFTVAERKLLENTFWVNITMTK